MSDLKSPHQGLSREAVVAQNRTLKIYASVPKANVPFSSCKFNAVISEIIGMA